MSKIIFFDKTNHYHFAEFKVHQRRKQRKLCDGNCWFVDPKFVKTCYQLANKWLEILKVSHYSKHICTLMSEWLVVLTECRLLPAMPDSSPATDFDIRSSFLKLWRGLRSRFTLSFHNVTHLLFAHTHDCKPHQQIYICHVIWLQDAAVTLVQYLQRTETP